MKISELINQEKPSNSIRNLLILIAVYHFILTFIAGSFHFDNLIKICVSECGLVTDTIVTAGLSATLCNIALVMMIAIAAVHYSGAAFSGNSFACIIMTAGFAAFGINPVNMIPVLFGTWLYSLLAKESFSKNVHIGLWACCTGPVVQYMLVHGGFSQIINTVLAVFMGIICGFLVPQFSAFTAKMHEGMNLYNVGFASGFVLIFLSAVLKGFGYTFEALSSWNTEHPFFIIVYLEILFILWFIAGYVLNGNSLNHLKEIGNRSGQKCDFIQTDGLGASMMNMAIVGEIAILYIIFIRGNFSGPVLAGIYSMFGYGAFGKQYKNVVWILLGIVILSFFSVWSLQDPAIQFSALLGTCICPIGGKYGILWGMIAGMVHICIVRQTGSFHSWLNLYNNGFAGGLASTMVLAVAKIFHINT